MAPDRGVRRLGDVAAAGAIAGTLFAVACYARLVPMPRGTAPAFVFTVVPGLCWLVIALAAWLVFIRRRPPRAAPKDRSGAV